jgi:hypothetical protein
VLPDCGSSAESPLLHFAARSLAHAGYRVSVLAWPVGRPPGLVAGRVAGQEVRHQAGRDVVRLVAEAGVELDDVAPGGVVLVAAALASHAIPWAAEHRVPGIWLAPVLTDPAVRAALPALPAGSLLVGGTADPSWDGAAAASSGLPVLQLADADGCLEIPGDVPRSIATLARVSAAISETLGVHRPVAAARAAHR